MKINNFVKLLSLIFSLTFYFITMPAGAVEKTKLINNHFTYAVVDVRNIQMALLKQIDQQILPNFKKQKNEIVSLGQNIEKMQKKLKTDADIMSKEDIDSYTNKIENKQRVYQRLVRAFEEDYRAQREEKLKASISKFQPRINKLAKDRNFDLIIAKEATLFFQKKNDITSEVLSIINHN